MLIGVDTTSEGVVDEEEHAADVLAYFSHPEYGMYAAVRYYYHARNSDMEEFDIFVMAPYPAMNISAYGVVPIQAINGHAHLLPGVKNKVDKDGYKYTEFHWDKVCSASLVTAAAYVVSGWLTAGRRRYAYLCIPDRSPRPRSAKERTLSRPGDHRPTQTKVSRSLDG